MKQINDLISRFTTKHNILPRIIVFTENTPILPEKIIVRRRVLSIKLDRARRT